MTQQPRTPQKDKTTKWIVGTVVGTIGCLMFLSMVVWSLFTLVTLQSCFSTLEKITEKEPATLYGAVRSYYYNQQTGLIDVYAVVTNTTDRPFLVEDAYLAFSDAYGQTVANDLVFYEPPRTLQPGESMPIRFQVFPSDNLRTVKQAVVKVHGWLLPKPKNESTTTKK